MKNQLRRPPSVWITQILLVTLALFSAIPIAGLVQVIGNGGAIGDVGFPLPFVVVLVAINLGVSFLYLLCFWALVRRKSFGQWLSALVLVTTLGAMALVAVGGVPIIIFLPVGVAFVFLIYRLAFGSAANAFFTKPDIN